MRDLRKTVCRAGGLPARESVLARMLRQKIFSDEGRAAPKKESGTERGNENSRTINDGRRRVALGRTVPPKDGRPSLLWLCRRADRGAGTKKRHPRMSRSDSIVGVLPIVSPIGAEGFCSPSSPFARKRSRSKRKRYHVCTCGVFATLFRQKTKRLKSAFKRQRE